MPVALLSSELTVTAPLLMSIFVTPPLEASTTTPFVLPFPLALTSLPIIKLAVLGSSKLPLADILTPVASVSFDSTVTAPWLMSISVTPPLEVLLVIPVAFPFPFAVTPPPIIIPDF